MLFKDDPHQIYFERFMQRDNVQQGDSERTSLFYLFALSPQVRGNINLFYDFQEHSPMTEIFNRNWTYGTRNIIKLAYNLYTAGVNKGIEKLGRYDLMGIMSEGDKEYKFEAIKIRLEI
jgi:hypothetical protein